MMPSGVSYFRVCPVENLSNEAVLQLPRTVTGHLSRHVTGVPLVRRQPPILAPITLPMCQLMDLDED